MAEWLRAWWTPWRGSPGSGEEAILAISNDGKSPEALQLGVG